MSDDTLIKERLEYLKRHTYEELNRLKTMILHDESQYGRSDFGECASVGISKCTVKTDSAGKNEDMYSKHRKTIKRPRTNRMYRKYKK